MPQLDCPNLNYDTSGKKAKIILGDLESILGEARDGNEFNVRVDSERHSQELAEYMQAQIGYLGYECLPFCKTRKEHYVAARRAGN